MMDSSDRLGSHRAAAFARRPLPPGRRSAIHPHPERRRPIAHRRPAADVSAAPDAAPLWHTSPMRRAVHEVALLVAILIVVFTLPVLGVRAITMALGTWPGDERARVVGPGHDGRRRALRASPPAS